MELPRLPSDPRKSVGRKIKILLLSTNSDEAGAPIHVRTLVEKLRSDVEFLVVFGERGPVADDLAATGVPVAIVPEMKSSISPVKDFVAIVKLSRHVRAFDPDIIHAHSSKAGMLGRIVGLLHRRATIYTVHGWGWRGLKPLQARAVYAIESLLRAVPRSHYVFVSKSVAEEARTILGIPSDRGRVVYNGVPDFATERPPGERPFTILMPARISTAKDHESLVRAFERVAAPSRLVLCGTGTADEAFLKSVAEWAPTRHGDVVGLGARRDMRHLLAEADVFALISNFEALPLSILEAMSAGCAVIASDVGGVGELITHRRTGLLVEKGNVDRIAEAIESLREDGLRTELAAAARRTYLNHFQADQMSMHVLNYYRAVIGVAA